MGWLRQLKRAAQVHAGDPTGINQSKLTHLEEFQMLRHFLVVRHSAAHNYVDMACKWLHYGQARTNIQESIPFKYFVIEWTTISAPKASGL